MPAKTARQRKFMGMASTTKGRKTLKAEGKKVPPLKVAKEFRRKGY